MGLWEILSNLAAALLILIVVLATMLGNEYAFKPGTVVAWMPIPDWKGDNNDK